MRPLLLQWPRNLQFFRDCCSGLRRLRRCAVPIAPLGHELVELGFVLGEAQAIKEVAKFALLFFETPKRLRPIFVEGAVAAGRRLAPAPRSVPGTSAYPLELVLHPGHLVFPAFDAVSTAAHSSTPNNKGQEREAHRPPDYEAEDHQTNPGRKSQFVELGGYRHFRPHV